MRARFLPLILACAACGDDARATQWLDLVELVNPFIGTGGEGFGYGGLSPAATAPNGMVKVGPDTARNGTALGMNHSAGYDNGDNQVRAFSHHRLPGIGVPDSGAVGFMLLDTESIDPDDALAYITGEVAEPGYYAVELEGRGQVELTATPRAAHHRYAWAGEQRWLVVDLSHGSADQSPVIDSWLETSGGHEVSGMARVAGDLTGRNNSSLPVHFVARFSRDWSEAHLWQDGARTAGSRVEGAETAATLRFTEDVEVRVGISFVDVAGARANLEAEMPSWSFEEIRKITRLAWEDALGALQVQGGNADEREILATALYHVLQMPTLATDVDGRYRGIDGEITVADGFTYYTDFSLWDTYRTLHPLVILLWPERAAHYAESLVTMGEAIGFLPRWPAGATESGSMVGSSADVVLAESSLKGISYREARGFEIAVSRALDPIEPGARSNLDSYLEHGYVPVEAGGSSVSHTMEYAVDDHAVARWAEHLGAEEHVAGFDARAGSWRNVFDASIGFVRGRHEDGTWADYSATAWAEYFAEGNCWQYTWMVPHDPLGLADAFGGRDIMKDKLEQLFELSVEEPDTLLPDLYYWHGNEPDLHAAFLFAELGHPALTQKWVAWVRRNKYDTSASGLDGNDDGGTLSAWYVLAALGLYPVVGTDRYILTTPVFDRVRLNLPEGRLVLESEGSGDYLKVVRLDGTSLERAEVRHGDLVGGHTLTFVRSDAPTTWGAW